MGIEETFERIAKALERIALAQERNMEINQAYKEHLDKREAERGAQSAPAEAVAPMDSAELPDGLTWNGPAAVEAPAPEAEKEMTFEELKSALHVRGLDFPKGTKRTTLVKAWEQHKNDPIVPATPSPVEPAPLDVNPAGYAPTLTEAPAQETAAPAAPMTREEAQRRIQSNYHPADDRDKLVEALASVGARMFTEVQEGQFEALVAKYEELKGAANA